MTSSEQMITFICDEIEGNLFGEIEQNRVGVGRERE